MKKEKGGKEVGEEVRERRGGGERERNILQEFEITANTLCLC